MEERDRGNWFVLRASGVGSEMLGRGQMESSSSSSSSSCSLARSTGEEGVLSNAGGGGVGAYSNSGEEEEDDDSLADARWVVCTAPEASATVRGGRRGDVRSNDMTVRVRKLDRRISTFDGDEVGTLDFSAFAYDLVIDGLHAP